MADSVLTNEQLIAWIESQRAQLGDDEFDGGSNWAFEAVLEKLRADEPTCTHGVLKNTAIPCDDCKAEVLDAVAAIRRQCVMTQGHSVGCECSDCRSIRRALNR